MESRKITTSWPHSTMRLAFSSTMLAIFTWRAAGSSNVEAMTSALTVRAMSVTSSGRSSMRSIIKYVSGWLRAMALAMSFMSIVLPVLGCATMRARCPLPMGVKRSTRRHDVLSPLPEQSLNFSSGKSGVRCSNATRSRTICGSRPLMRSMVCSVKYLSPSFGILTCPSTTSPGFRPCCRICCAET